jgi:hypothetical protein
MSQHDAYTSKLLSMDTARCEFQAVATRDHLVLDIATRNYGVDGRERREYALAHLSLRDAARLARLLAEAIVASQNAPDPRQTSLWSDGSVAAVADELRRGQLS